MKFLFKTERILTILTLLLVLGAAAWAQEATATLTFSELAGQFLTTPTVKGTLLALAIAFWFLAVVTLGSGVAEVGCFVCLVLLFGGRYLAGVDNWLPVGLFAAGAIFALVEVFVLPGFGVFGIMSIVSFGALSVFVMDSPQTGMLVFSTSVLVTAALGTLVFKYLPKFVITRKLFVLEPPIPETDSAIKVALPMIKVGDVGETASTLRPVGMAMFANQRLEVMSDSAFVKKGVQVEVVRIDGQKIVVRPQQ